MTQASTPLGSVKSPRRGGLDPRRAVILALSIIAIAAIPSLALAQPGGRADWDKLVEAAKKEVVVSVWGPPGAWARTSLVDEFQKSYPQIAVEYQGASGSAAWPKIEAERRAGLFTVDIHIGGISTAGTALYKAKAHQAIEPAFIFPEVKDAKAWWQGKFHFGDPDNKFVFIFSISPIPALAYNPQLVDPKEFHSYRDLLQPKWKGKLVMLDPREAGPGSARWHFLAKAMGKEYLEQLAKQIVITRDLRQSVEWIANAKYPAGIGLSDVHVTEFSKKGATVAQISHLAEGNYLSAGWGTANLIDRAPHPNAAKLYINWLLSREGQSAWQKSGYNSARIDIPKDTVDPMNRIGDGVKYYEQFTAAAVKERDEVSTKYALEFIKD
jgi:iron(III) transport system substrate-binding protein